METCIIPNITYAGEVWQRIEKETIQLNAILDKILRRTLKPPPPKKKKHTERTPIQTGLLDIQTLHIINRMTTNQRPNKTQNALIMETRRMDRESKQLAEKTDPLKHAMQMEEQQCQQTTTEQKIIHKAKMAFRQK